MAITFEQAAQRLGNAVVTVAGPGSERALIAAGLEAKKEMSAGGRRDSPLSRYGRGARRGRVDAKAGFETEAGLRIVVHPAKGSRGLWALLELGSGSTWKTPRRLGVTRRARGSVGTYQRTPVRPRRTWSDAQPRATREAFHAFHRKLVTEVHKDLRGG